MPILHYIARLCSCVVAADERVQQRAPLVVRERSPRAVLRAFLIELEAHDAQEDDGTGYGEHASDDAGAFDEPKLVNVALRLDTQAERAEDGGDAVFRNSAEVGFRRVLDGVLAVVALAVHVHGAVFVRLCGWSVANDSLDDHLHERSHGEFDGDDTLESERLRVLVKVLGYFVKVIVHEHLERHAGGVDGLRSKQKTAFRVPGVPLESFRR